MPKEVRFDLYCKSCEYSNKASDEYPCTKCLGKPDNGDSHRPIMHKKVRPYVNYFLPDTNLVHPGYTRDWRVSENWSLGEPTESELKQYFELKDGDWYEKE